MQPPCGLSQRRGRESVITEEEIYTPQFLPMQIGSSILREIFSSICEILKRVKTSYILYLIQLLESPIPAPAPAPPAPSQKASSDDISGTKRGTIDPLVSKRPEKILNKKI